MGKYLFTDGISGVMEIHSGEELQTRIDAAIFPDKIRIWVFNSHEWISYDNYRKKFPLRPLKEMTPASFTTGETGARKGKTKPGLRKFLVAGCTVLGIFLIYDFTKIRWTKAPPLNTIAARPGNVPLMNIDSLINAIENDRGVVLDRGTRTNLRLRNTWPDKIELRLHSERETGNGTSRYFNVKVSIDNATGFLIDEAVVRISAWKKGKMTGTDTIRYNDIRYDMLSARPLIKSYHGDSMAVSFESIRAKAFNFCYAASVINKPGNYHDRWYCRYGVPGRE